MKKSMVKHMVLAAALAAALGAPGMAAAQQKITLRVADFYPTSHKTPVYMTKFWMERVTTATGGQVAFEYYPAEQLGKAKDLMTLAVSGATDVSGFATSYVSDKMPLSSVAELPGGAPDSCAATKAYYQLASSGILADADYSANGVRLLFVVVNPPFQLYLKKASLGSLDEIRGMKIRTTGGAQDATVRQLKGVPVRMAGPEIFEALSRGTLDGILFPSTSIFSYNLEKLLKVGTSDLNFGAGVLPYVIGAERWKNLPENVRAAMAAAGREASERACALIDKDVAPSHDQLRAAGVNLVNPSAQMRQALKAELAVVSRAWAADLDKRGRPGTKVFDAYEAALRR